MGATAWRKWGYVCDVLPAHVSVILIGLRGSGKSTVARLLAARMGRAAVDLDERVDAALRVATAGDAIRAFGEPAFRRAELQALQEVLRTHGQVVALGGGTPTAPGVAEMLESEKKRGRAVVVYLRASAGVLRSRVERDKVNARNRPSLTGAGALDEIEVLLNLRDTLYTSLASAVIDVDRGSSEDAVEAVVSRL